MGCDWLSMLSYDISLPQTQYFSTLILHRRTVDTFYCHKLIDPQRARTKARTRLVCWAPVYLANLPEMLCRPLPAGWKTFPETRWHKENRGIPQVSLTSTAPGQQRLRTRHYDSKIQKYLFDNVQTSIIHINVTMWKQLKYFLMSTCLEILGKVLWPLSQRPPENVCNEDYGSGVWAYLWAYL